MILSISVVKILGNLQLVYSHRESEYTNKKKGSKQGLLQDDLLGKGKGRKQRKAKRRPRPEIPPPSLLPAERLVRPACNHKCLWSGHASNRPRHSGHSIPWREGPTSLLECNFKHCPRLSATDHFPLPRGRLHTRPDTHTRTHTYSKRGSLSLSFL